MPRPRSRACGGRDRRPCDARSRAGRRCARASMCSSRAGRRPCRIDEAGQGKLRSQGRAQSRADVGGGMIVFVECKTSFTLAQLADRRSAEADRILRACVHCGFCTATCPTYVLLATSSTPARAHLPDQGHAGARPAAQPPSVVKHIDRCLSCLACMTTCPSGVHYMHLVDHARAHIEATYVRPLLDRALRAMLARVLPA